MVIVKETNQFTRNGWVVTRDVTHMSDSDYDEKQRMIRYRLAKLKRKKIAELTKDRRDTFNLIQHYQKQALEVESDRDALTITEYLTMILIPQLHNIDRELKALTK